MNGNRPAKTPLALDRDRVMCLLLINTRLMKRAIHMYNQVFTNISQVPANERQKLVEQYQNLTRRIHCNLQALTYLHEKYHLENSSGQNSNKTPFPLIIGPPAEIPELNELYTKLQELYPEAVQFIKLKTQQLKEQQAARGKTNSSISNSSNSQMTNQQQPTSQPGMMMMNSPMANSPMANGGMNNSPMMGNMTPNSMNLNSGRQVPQQYNQYQKVNDMNMAPSNMNMNPANMSQNNMNQNNMNRMNMNPNNVQNNMNQNPQNNMNGINMNQNMNQNNMNMNMGNMNMGNMNMNNNMNLIQQQQQAVSPQQVFQQMGSPNNNLLNLFN